MTGDQIFAVVKGSGCCIEGQQVSDRQCPGGDQRQLAESLDSKSLSPKQCPRQPKSLPSGETRCSRSSDTRPPIYLFQPLPTRYKFPHHPSLRHSLISRAHFSPSTVTGGGMAVMAVQPPSWVEAKEQPYGAASRFNLEKVYCLNMFS